MRIITKRQHLLITTYSRSFTYIRANGEETGSGCSFDCDKDGVVDTSKLQPAGLANYMSALTGIETRWEGSDYTTTTNADGDVSYHRTPGTGILTTLTVRDDGAVKYEKWHHEAAVGECQCHRHVHLTSFTNTCECGRDYNMSGQLLAHRSQWGEETGESLSDILSIGVGVGVGESVDDMFDRLG